MLDKKTNILITGIPDEILHHPHRGIWIGDYKTARFTDAQDALEPMYRAQLNCYAFIASQIGLGSVYGLGLLFCEPTTDLENADPDQLIKDRGFFLEFIPKLKPVRLEPNIALLCCAGFRKSVITQKPPQSCVRDLRGRKAARPVNWTEITCNAVVFMSLLDALLALGHSQSGRTQ